MLFRSKETVRLYYPVDSLNTILGSNAKNDQEMLTLLRKAFEEKSSLGELHFHSHAGRVEISIPPEGSQWVHEQRYYPDRSAEKLATQPNMATSSSMIGTNVAYETGYTGAGTRIAVIDTGIDTDHQIGRAHV